MAYEACARLGGAVERGVAEEAVPRARLVKKGTAADGLLLSDATDRPLGASLNQTEAAIDDEVEFGVAGNGDWTELTASAAVAANAEFIGAADGKIAPLPTSGGGTKDALGILHREGHASADGDICIGRLYDVPVTRTIAT